MTRLILAALAALILSTSGAVAQPEAQPWVRYVVKQQCYRKVDMFGAVTYPCYQRVVRARNHTYRLVDEYAYRAPERDRYEEGRWERRDPMIERGVSCKPTEVRVIGRKHLTQNGALKEAVDKWQADIGYDFGEKWMSIENARDYRFRCDRASTNETGIGRAAEGVANALTGGQAEAYYKRCVVIARPCMQPVQRGDKEDR